MNKMVGAAEFKAKCLKLIDEMQKDGIPITITKRGKPVAEMSPAVAAESAAESDAIKEPVFGCMAGTVTFASDYDPSEPAYDGLWDAELGKWGPED